MMRIFIFLVLGGIVPPVIVTTIRDRIKHGNWIWKAKS